MSVNPVANFILITCDEQITSVQREKINIADDKEYEWQQALEEELDNYFDGITDAQAGALLRCFDLNEAQTLYDESEEASIFGAGVYDLLRVIIVKDIPDFIILTTAKELERKEEKASCECECICEWDSDTECQCECTCEESD
jgi:hypothetical protein